MCLLHRLFKHSQDGGQLSLLHEVDLCVMGISSLTLGGPSHTHLAAGSVEATTHVIDMSAAADGYPEPPQVVCLLLLVTSSARASVLMVVLQPA